ncbi:hypothetical protein HDV00_012839 [Rhizophlyctis rosea]|nr:hypothetical protein HDV00_012839 [Rhizophlyctis rosea]
MGLFSDFVGASKQQFQRFSTLKRASTAPPKAPPSSSPLSAPPDTVAPSSATMAPKTEPATSTSSPKPSTASDASKQSQDAAKAGQDSKADTPEQITIGSQLVNLTINTAFKGLTLKEILEFRPFADWLTAMNEEMRTSPARNHVTIKGVTVTDADRFGPKLGFLKFHADIQWIDDEDAQQSGKIPGIVFARGGSVAILVILTPSEASTKSEGGGPTPPTDQKHTPEDLLDRVVLTLQPRIPIGALAFPELPAGMLDGERHQFAGAAARELEEECGIIIKSDELTDLTDLALGPTNPIDVSHGKGVGGKPGCMYPSPGGSDEWIKLFLCRKTMPLKDIQALEGKQGGLREDGEKITCKIIKLRDLWRSTRDFKALGAVALYDNLVREGKL